MKAKVFSLALFISFLFSTTTFGQLIGENPGFWLSKYNFLPVVGKSEVVTGDTLGIMGFRGYTSGGFYQRGAGLYAIVTDAPTPDGFSSRLSFATGAPVLQDRMTILENGFIGIGTNTPTKLLHVSGDALIDGDFTIGGNFVVAGNIEAGQDLIAGRDVIAGRNVEAADNVNATNASFTQNLEVGNYVAIGTTSTPAGYRLYVEDGILAERVKVAVDGTASWSDYVFKPDYNLLPLKQVEHFIQQNGHLPGIPSAEEVVANGIDVATMDAKLLEKIEELTLHLIDLEKRLKQMEAENQTLKSSLKRK